MATLIAILAIMLLTVAGAVYASDDPVYVLTQLPYEAGAFDTVLNSGRLTGGNTEESEYRVASVPLSSELEPMLTLPESDVLSALLEALSRAERTDGMPFADGDVQVELAISQDTYAVAVRFNVETQLDEITFYVNSLLTSNGADFHWLLPIVRDLPVTILRVDDRMLDKLSDDLDSDVLPAEGDFVMAHVSFSNDNYRIISIAMTETALVWFELIEARDAADIYGELSDYDNTTDARPVSTPIPASYTVRPFALLSIQERTQAWLDGAIEWVEPNCFTLEGECYRQGYNGITLDNDAFQGTVGTFLGVEVTGESYIVYVGYTSQSGERYFVPYMAGRDATNALGVVVMPTPTIEGQSDIVGYAPWRQGWDVAGFLNPYIASPVMMGVVIADTQGLPDDVANRMRLQYPQAEEYASWIYSVTMNGVDPTAANSPWYVNVLLEDDTRADELVASVSITFGRYI